MNNIALQKEIARLEAVVQGLTQERDELAAVVEAANGVKDERGLLPCIHCGGRPYYSVVEEYDDRRYMRMTLTCCAGYDAALGYKSYREMTESQIKEHLQKSLTAQWNARVAMPATLPSVLHEIRAKVLEEARDYFNGSLSYNFMYQEHILSGAYSDASGELDVMAAAERVKGEKK